MLLENIYLEMEKTKINVITDHLAKFSMMTKRDYLIKYVDSVFE